MKDERPPLPEHRGPPRVSALRPRGAETVEVWLDGRPWRRLHEDVVVRARVQVGCVLDRDRARAIARERRAVLALSVAAGMLRARDHSSAALRRRLDGRGVSAGAAAEAVAMLERVGVLDDRRFARRRAERLAERGLGDAAIRADLEAQALEPAAVAEAIAALEPEATRVARLVGRDGASLRTLQRLVRRGFSEESLEVLVASLDHGAIA